MMFERYYCVGCGQSKAKPFMKWILNEIGICRECSQDIKMTGDMTFESKEFIDIVISPFLYDGIVKEIVCAFKFSGQRRYGDFLTALAFEYIKDNNALNEYDIIVPVPLHKNRFDERTFNQSDIISKRLGKLMNKEVNYSALVRIRDTLHQSSLKGADRVNNVKDAFLVSESGLEGKKIILVDDIYTMGETANECAKALRLAGAEKVAVFTLCKRIAKQKSGLF